MKITEVSPQKNNPLKVNVFIDGKYRFSLDGADAVLRGIKPGMELDDDDVSNLMMDSQYTKALDKAFDIISGKSITAFDLQKKLIEKDYDKAVVLEVIRELESMGYIDDEAYASLYLEYSLEKLWGKRKIRYEMQKKGISDKIIENTLSSYDEEAILSLLAEYICQRYDDPADIKTKAKITRHFASRGFEFSIINMAIAIAIGENTDE